MMLRLVGGWGVSIRRGAGHRGRGLAGLAAARGAPDRALLAITGPIALLLHRVPTWLVRPIVIAAADYQAFLCPYDLRPNLKALPHKALRNRHRAQRGVPNVSD